ncbi:hypothetical protein ACEUZ9_004131 [Paracoccus litorisediminis]|uniref:hypothetical protein n=1 Tax=Paracoccus litorisediminis TaxID=2006130 RepID=UPI00372DA021
MVKFASEERAMDVVAAERHIFANFDRLTERCDTFGEIVPPWSLDISTFYRGGVIRLCHGTTEIMSISMSPEGQSTGIEIPDAFEGMRVRLLGIFLRAIDAFDRQDEMIENVRMTSEALVGHLATAAIIADIDALEASPQRSFLAYMSGPAEAVLHGGFTYGPHWRKAEVEHSMSEGEILVEKKTTGPHSEARTSAMWIRRDGELAEISMDELRALAEPEHSPQP